MISSKKNSKLELNDIWRKPSKLESNVIWCLWIKVGLILTPRALSYTILISSHLKLCLATARIWEIVIKTCLNDTDLVIKNLLFLQRYSSAYYQIIKNKIFIFYLPIDNSVIVVAMVPGCNLFSGDGIILIKWNKVTRCCFVLRWLVVYLLSFYNGNKKDHN